MKNIYRGRDALQQFHDPHNYITPLVELPESLNPYYNNGIHIYAKLLYMNPLLNIKSLPARYMVQDALSNSSDINHFVESSSGNTAYSVSVYGKVYNNCDTTAIVSTEVTEGKRKLLSLMGLNIKYNNEPICPNPNDPESSINIAKSLGKKDGRHNLGQYDNDINWKSHYDITGPQIFNQLPEIDGIITSLGTTGTLLGISQYLKKQNPDIYTIGVVRKENNPIPGPRTEGLLSHIGFDWKKWTDQIIKVGTHDAYQYSTKLCQYGILGGPSSGMNYYATLEYAQSQLAHNRGVHLVFACPDTALPYLYDYEVVLDTTNSEGYTVQQLIDDMQYLDNLWIIDLRPQDQFNEYHIDAASSIPFHYVDEFVETSLSKEYKYVFVCSYGSKSDIVAKYVKSLGYNAQSLESGIIHRYNSGYPVCKNQICIHK
ncbi:putative siderophore biosynthesis protein SbnA [candidate division SR1 bacterium Aalborg_AAW-1]|nr:putative siderophore biosynthesis protein SbnA [candidate division SR1 bacterium Aalborg_AAW-1]